MARTLFLAPEDLGAFFRTNLADRDAVFVFSTDIVKNSWVDWCVMHPEQSGVTAVPLERFMAWDDFKGTAVRAQEDGKASVPAMLRKFFVSSLIAQNAAAPDDAPIFKTLINPAFRGDAQSFAGWLSKLLPSLKLWHDRVLASKGYVMDDEDKDYLTLFTRYRDFLDAHHFFEPSWIQPDFAADKKRYILLYPELLEDYADYVDVFCGCPEVTLVSLPPERLSAERVACNKFSDARKELRRVILQIRCLAQNTRWDGIALSVPALDTYRPYLERELAKYCVPFVIRAGFPIVRHTAAQVFTQIQQCYASDFSYDSVRSLILNEYIPWKAEFAVLRQNLIREGSRMRCICGFDERNGTKPPVYFDSWEAALSATSNTNSRELKFYAQLKHDVISVCKAGSFADVRKAWIVFRDRYLDAAYFSDSANDIIGRCVTELNALAELEEAYCTEQSGLGITDHFGFFMTELTAKTYTPQTKQSGVQVFPYKVAAGAPFAYHFVIDASQRNLEVQYTRLGFLNAEKRRALGLDAEDKKYNASRAFISLYAAHMPTGGTEQGIRFSYAEDSFAGFAICHNALSVPTRWNEKKHKDEEILNPLSGLDADDFILAERRYMLGGDAGDGKPLCLSRAQKEQVARWHFFNMPEGAEPGYRASDAIRKQVARLLVERRGNDGGITITQTDMKRFFPCPRKWVLSNVIRLTEDSLDTSLMQPFDMGNINHKILELFMKDYERSQQPLPVTGDDGTFGTAEDAIYATVKAYARDAITRSPEDFAHSPLTQKMLLAQEQKIAAHIMDFLHEFLKLNAPPPRLGKTSKTPGYGGCIVRGVELPLHAQGDDQGFGYYGKLDLLLTASDSNPDALGWTIIDYKNSAVPAQKDIMLDDDGNLGDFQMPMYVTLLQKNKAVQDIDVARFYSIKNPHSPTCAIDQYTTGKDMEQFAPVLGRFAEYARQFATDVQSGAFCPDAERVDVYADCQSCSFGSVCRHTYEVAKRDMPRHAQSHAAGE